VTNPQTPDSTRAEPSRPTTWKDASEIDAAIARMAEDLTALIRERRIAPVLMIGIHSGGVWVAERLHALLGLAEPLGTLDISFYRDDFTRIGMHPQVRPSRLPVAVEDRHLILVDDVLQTGRTIRAALNVLFDYGRPKSVILATLTERDGRQLPIEPNVVGLRVRLGPEEQIKLAGPEPLVLVHALVPKKPRRPPSDAHAAAAEPAP
jgi:pyrimidine operon attenuation protein/uracil phosphoribosyltransferase